MGLYLCVFSSPDEDDEIEGVEVGSYDDLHFLRTIVAERLEHGNWASRFPVLMSHSDSDGEWSPAEAAALADEIRVMDQEFSTLPPIPFPQGSWQENVAKQVGLVPTSLAECFIDVDGEPLLGRLRDLASKAVEHSCPISFQ